MDRCRNRPGPEGRPWSDSFDIGLSFLDGNCTMITCRMRVNLAAAAHVHGVRECVDSAWN